MDPYAAERHEQPGSPHKLMESAMQNVGKVMVGKGQCIRQAMIALLCSGHLLLEDVPGVGKTMMVKALAKSIGAVFRRIQFTPDLLPSDVTGISIYNQRTGEFEFREGPIMANVVLADEINRASPRTQSALLEAMEEKQVTADGKTLKLPEPFLVMATQNPRDYQGTFMLPEALTDRFMIRLKLGYLDPEQEAAMLDRMQDRHPIERIRPVLTAAELKDMQRQVKDVYVEASLKRYIVQLVAATRQLSGFKAGASPRATIALMKAAQANAWLDNRSYCIPDDIKAQYHAVIEHRLIPASDYVSKPERMASVLDRILAQTAVPVMPSAESRISYKQEALGAQPKAIQG